MKQIILFLLLTTLLFAEDLTNTPAYTFFLKNQNTTPSKVFKLQDQFDNNNAVVIAFFAEWCAPCHKELPVLDSINAAYDDVTVVAISLDKVYPAEAVKKLGLTMPVLHDKFKIISKKYGYSGKLPYTIYIGKDGVIKSVSDGYSDEKKGEVVKLVEGLRK